jgi:colanic acid biosynthesis glycosyl transferase WcaI
MKIAIVGINHAPELTGIAVYTTGMAEYLARRGASVSVYCSFPYYPQWAKRSEDRGRLHGRERIGGVDVRRHYAYVPSRPSAARRILHELSFVASTAIGYLLGPRADCTIIVSPPLFLGLPIALIARLKRSRVVVHVQDLQPDAALDLGMLRPGRLTAACYWIERRTYALADRVWTISRGMCERILGKGVAAAKTFVLRNWANEDAVGVLGHDTRYRAEWGLDGRFVVLYAGNLGVKQGLGTVLECARLLRQREDIVFLVVGDGGEKAALIAQARALGLSNVRFEPLQAPEHLGELLATADVSLVPQKRGVKDIVLPSKLSNILASGRPVVVAAGAETELGEIVRDSGAGMLVEPEDGAAMAEALLALRADPALRQTCGRNARRYMEARLHRETILAGMMQEIEALLAKKPPLPLAYRPRPADGSAPAP